MEEIWKDIEGYEGLYQISNLGMVRRGNHLLKIEITNKGYCRVQLSKDGIVKRYSLHRLVAQTFISNPNNYPVVNHKDLNPLNCCVDNLEWCDFSYNNHYDEAYEKRVKTRRSNDNYKITEETRLKMRSKKIGTHSAISMKVSQFTKDGNYIATFVSMREASLKTGVCHSSITQVCKGLRKTAGGYKWRYAS